MFPSHRLPRRLLAALTTAVLTAPLAVTFGAAPAAAANPAPAVTVTNKVTAAGQLGGATDRRCALSTRLPDGNILWVFCGATRDPANPHAATAALSRAGSPGTLIERVSDGKVAPLFPVTAADLNAKATNPNCAVSRRPLALTAVPDDTVVVFWERQAVCGPVTSKLGRGTSELRYTPGLLAGTTALTTTDTTEAMFPQPGPQFGDGAVFADGYLYMYGSGPSGTGPFVARSPAYKTRATWTFWTGAAWSPSTSNLQPVSGPRPADGVLGAITWVPSLNLYAAARTDGTSVSVRFSPTPTGAWSAPNAVTVPGCAATCAHAAVVGEMSPFGALHVVVTPSNRSTLWSFPVRPGPTATVEPVGATNLASRDLTGSPLFEPVRPPTNAKNYGIGRDGGTTVQLSDGNTLWLHGDTAKLNDLGQLQYFINNTAAISRPGSPNVVEEPLTANGTPYQLILPPPSFTCSAGQRVIWPNAAVKVAEPGVDRVYIWYQKLCVNAGDSDPGPDHGTNGLARFDYTPGKLDLSKRWTTTILNDDVLPKGFHSGAASLVGNDVFIHSCQTAPGVKSVWPADVWGCRVAKVPVAQAANPSAYRYWDGADWHANVAAAASMAMPDTQSPARNPNGMFDVEYLESTGLWVMAYTTWPGFSPTLAVRTAVSPQGPWSIPDTIDFPGCRISGHTCYGANIFESLSGDDALSVVHFDMNGTDPRVRPDGTLDPNVPAGKPGGELHTVRVPWLPTGSKGSRFTPMKPHRLLDSREATGGWSGPMPGGQPRELDVAGVAGIPHNVTAVALNVTITAPVDPSFLTVWPSGSPQPNASNLNFLPGESVSNGVTVAVGGDGKLLFSLPGGARPAHVIADVVGFYAAEGGSAFNAVPPSRLLDSRESNGGWKGKIGQLTTRQLQVSGRGGVPVGATAAVLNVTVTEPDAGSYLTVYPSGGTRPGTSSINFAPNQSLSNLVTVALSNDGKVDVFHLLGSTHVVMDVVGYYGSGGQRFFPAPPRRVLDSRVGVGQSGPWAQQQTRNLAVSGGRAPAGATAVAFNLTITQPNAPSFVTAFPAGMGVPNASNVNFSPGSTRPNLVVLGMGSNGSVSLYNHLGSVHLIADVAGYYAP